MLELLGLDVIGGGMDPGVELQRESEMESAGLDGSRNATEHSNFPRPYLQNDTQRREGTDVVCFLAASNFTSFYKLSSTLSLKDRPSYAYASVYDDARHSPPA
jgi:hypothetical protein